MKKGKVKIGDRVTVREPVPAYYSAYGGNRASTLRPGMTGTVAAVDVPSVTHDRSFVCVDFWCPANQKIMRAGVLYPNLQEGE